MLPTVYESFSTQFQLWSTLGLKHFQLDVEVLKTNSPFIFQDLHVAENLLTPPTGDDVTV